jgi:hypothetical protein
MSTILDALRKSEQERKLNDLPTLTDMAAPEEHRRISPVLTSVLIALLLVLIGILIYWVLQNTAAQKSTSAPNSIVLSNDTLEAETAKVNENEEIIVNVVSWSKQPEQRFAMINGKLYRENEFVRAGLKLESIQADSVVLNQRGQRIIRQP